MGWLVLLPAVPGDGFGPRTHSPVWRRQRLPGVVRFATSGSGPCWSGVWTLIQIRGPILQSLQQLMTLYRTRDVSHSSEGIPRTERDAGVVWLIGLTVAALVPMLLLYRSLLGQSLLGGPA